MASFGRPPLHRLFGDPPATWRCAMLSWSAFIVIYRNRIRQALTAARYTMPLLFPLLDSYPAIFDVRSGHIEKLAVHAGLTTSTAVAEQVRTVEQIVKRLVSVDEREALCNGLQVIAEEYDEGWDGDFTDSDDDD